MPVSTLIAFALWGLFSGPLLLLTFENLLAAGICLQGLLRTRWKRLVNKAAPGQIHYSISLRALLRAVLLGVFFWSLYQAGTTLMRREFGAGDQLPERLAWAIPAALVALFLLRGSCRRLVVAWKITHVFDFAEKRRRTFLLRKP